MTWSGRGQQHLDEMGLSAMLDGEADREAADHVASCADCLDRLARWESARSMVAAPVPPPDPVVREAALAAALAGVDSPTVEPPIPMASHRGRRRHRAAPVLVSAAAAVVIGAAVLAAANSGHHRSQAATGAASSPTAAPANVGAPARPAASATVPPTPAPAGPEAKTAAPSGSTQSAYRRPEVVHNTLGTYPNAQALAARLKSLPRGSLVAGPASPIAQPCQAQAAVMTGGLGQPAIVAPLTYEGDPAVVYVYAGTSLVLRTGNCALLGRVGF